MSDIVYLAPPMSRANIEDGTMALRRLMGMTEPFLDVVRIFEWALGSIAPGFDYEILDHEIMGVRHGQMDPARKMVALRQDVYDGLVAHYGPIRTGRTAWRSHWRRAHGCARRTAAADAQAKHELPARRPHQKRRRPQVGDHAITIEMPEAQASGASVMTKDRVGIKRKEYMTCL